MLLCIQTGYHLAGTGPADQLGYCSLLPGFAGSGRSRAGNGIVRLSMGTIAIYN